VKKDGGGKKKGILHGLQGQGVWGNSIASYIVVERGKLRVRFETKPIESGLNQQRQVSS